MISNIPSGVNYIIPPSFTQKKPLSKTFEDTKQNAPLNRDVSVPASLVSSKVNISFKGQGFDIEKFASDFEAKIKNQLTPSYEIKSPLTAQAINEISQTFKNDGVGRIFKCGVSLNNALKYLASKGQIEFAAENNEAFFVDKLSLGWLKNNLESFNEHLQNNKVVFYSLGDNNDNEKISEEFEKLTGIPAEEIKKVNCTKDNSSFNYPDAETIKAALEIFAERKYPDNKLLQEEYKKIIAKYMDDSLFAFSYQSLAEKTKEQYKEIEKKVLKSGKTMDDVIYIIPEERKSYDVINYLYACENNVPSDKFASLCEVYDYKNPKDKVFVILDDLSSTGGSIYDILLSDSRFLFREDGFNLTFCPIFGTASAESMVSYAIKRSGVYNVSFIPVIKHNDIQRFFELHENAEHGNEGSKKELEEYSNKLKLTEKEINYLEKNLMPGCGSMRSFVSFPYMVPDNSCEVNTVLGSYFLNNDVNRANKGIEGVGNKKGQCTVEGERIKEDDYNDIKNQISSRISKLTN